MYKLLRNNHRLVFYLAWLIINIIQAGYTELFDDEAYYWVYSRFTDWGYFDHPPMIALLIKGGYAIIPNELGVRLFIVLMNTATILLIDELTEKKDSRLFYAIAASIVVTQIGGFMAVPDIPLLFFGALFFWMYKRFTEKPDYLHAVYLGIVMALMLYSKYHGILLIAFTFLSNLKLFRKAPVYVAAVTGILLFLPHLYWQYTHDFISVQFHLFERSASAYRFSYTIEYLLGQIAMAGPIMGWLLLWAAFRNKPLSAINRALYFSMAGVFVLFLISTFKGRVEANWTLPAFIPMMVLSHQYLTEKVKLRKWLYRAVPVSVILVLLTRIYMMLDMPPVAWISKDEMHYNKVWTNDIEQRAGNLPVIFIGSYQRPSKYWFYTQHPAYSLNTAFYRRNNFNLWSLEDSLIGKPAFLSIPDPSTFFKTFLVAKGWAFPAGYPVKKFYAFSRVSFNHVRTVDNLVNDSLITATVEAPAEYLQHFREDSYKNTALYLAFYEDGDVSNLVRTNITVNQLTHNGQQISIPVPAAYRNGQYSARICIGSCLAGFPTINSATIKLKGK